MKVIQLLSVNGVLYKLKRYRGDEYESCNKCALKKECDNAPDDFSCRASPDENYVRFNVGGSSFDWDKFAKDLEDKFGECLISADDADETNPYDYWLQDVTVADIVDFCKNYR